MRHILILGWNVLRVFRALALYNITLKSLSSCYKIEPGTKEDPQSKKFKKSKSSSLFTCWYQTKSIIFFHFQTPQK